MRSADELSPLEAAAARSRAAYDRAGERSRRAAEQVCPLEADAAATEKAVAQTEEVPAATLRQLAAAATRQGRRAGADRMTAGADTAQRVAEPERIRARRHSMGAAETRWRLAPI